MIAPKKADVAVAFCLDRAGVYGTVLLNVPREGDVFELVDPEGKTTPCRVLARDDKTGLSLLEANPAAQAAKDSENRPRPLAIGQSIRGLEERSLELLTAGGEPAKTRLLGREISMLGAPYPLRVLHFNFGPKAQGKNWPGAPITDEQGRIVAVVLFAGAGEPSVKGIPSSFALPCEVIEKILKNFEEFGRVETGWIGLGIDDTRATPIVMQVSPEGPSAKAGVRPGDLILSIGERRIKHVEDVVDAFYFMTPGERVRVHLLRGLDEIEVNIVPTKRGTQKAAPEQPAPTVAPEPDIKPEPPAPDSPPIEGKDKTPQKELLEPAKESVLPPRYEPGKKEEASAEEPAR